jgi:hypothetical protein
MIWKDWLSEGSFYIHGIVYMLVRIAVNVTMVIIFIVYQYIVCDAILFIVCD